MKKIVLAAPLAILLLVITNAQITSLTIADPYPLIPPYPVYLPDIVIESNGSIVPDIGFINHTGNVYTLTGDISNYSLVIQCNNITFDGNGHIINGSQANPNYETSSDGLTLNNVTNVTVKDLEIVGFNNFGGESIKAEKCFNCTFLKVKTLSIDLQSSYFNTITENIIGKLTLFVSHYNIVTENNITSIFVQFCDSNKCYGNNFLSANNFFQFYYSNKESFWDNGSIGNYWSDYLTRFPNASENGTSGIGNTPYVVNDVPKAWINGEYVYQTGTLFYIIDHYPLMKPIPVEPVLLTTSPSPSIAPTPTAQTSTILLLTGIAAATVVLGVFLVYFKKRKR